MPRPDARRSLTVVRRGRQAWEVPTPDRIDKEPRRTLMALQVHRLLYSCIVAKGMPRLSATAFVTRSVHAWEAFGNYNDIPVTGVRRAGDAQ